MKTIQPVLVVNYHYIRDFKNTRFPNFNGCTIKQFRQQIEYLVENYNAITMEMYLDHISNPGKYPLPEHAFMVTFDDGYLDHYTNALPILNEYNIKGAFYVPACLHNGHQLLMYVNKIHILIDYLREHIKYKTDALEDFIKIMWDIIDGYRGEFKNELLSKNEYQDKYRLTGYYDDPDIMLIKRLLQVGLPRSMRDRIIDELTSSTIGKYERVIHAEMYMSIDQVRYLEETGHHIGGHSYTHQHMDSLTDQELGDEIDETRWLLQEVDSPDRYYTFCYPYGSHDQRAVELLKLAGFKLAFGIEDKITCACNDNLFNLPRVDTMKFQKVIDGTEQL